MAADQPLELFTLDEIVKEVGENFGDTSAISNTKIKKAINRAIIQIRSWGPWLFLEALRNFTTTKDQATYTLSAALKMPQFITVTGAADRKLTKVDKRNYRTFRPDPTTSSGTPLVWFLDGRQAGGGWKVTLDPIPDAAFEMKVDSELVFPLLDDGDDDIRTVSFMPEELLPGIIDVASALMNRKIDDANYRVDFADAKLLVEDIRADMDRIYDDEMDSREYGTDHTDFHDPVLPTNFDRC